MRIQEEIQTSLAVAVRSVVGHDVAFSLEHPSREVFGDLTTNVALSLEGNAVENAKKILAAWKKSAVVASVEVAGPGFINIRLSDGALIDELKNASTLGAHIGYNACFANQNVMIEFTDPNPFKEFHIGHLYSNTVGESLSRLFEAGGATVKRANYQGDVGMHVAKALYGINAKFKLLAKPSSFGAQISNLEKRPLAEKTKFLGEAYAVGAKAFEEDASAKDEMTALNKKIFDRDPSVTPLYEAGRRWSLEAFERIYARLGTKFDFYYFESGVGEIGKQLVLEYLDRGVFVRSEKAVIFPGEKEGLHNRVFINSLGLPTYEAKELGLAPTKFKDFPYDLSIIVTGNEINEYFKVLIAALGKIEPKLAAKTKHISHGMVRLPEGKMSSRTGNILTGEWLLDDAKKRLQKAYPSMYEDVAEAVAVGAVKYALLRVSLGKDIIFDFDRSLNFEGDSGPYIQYTHARTQSVLANSKRKAQSLKLHEAEQKLNDEELAILRFFYRFPDVVQQATTAYSPGVLCTFLFDLAQRYNTFYNKHRIVDAKDTSREFRLLLTSVVGKILQNGLWLLGIQAPEKL